MTSYSHFVRLLTLLLTLAASTMLASATRKLVVVNNCPSGINVYSNGNRQAWISANGGSTVASLSNDFSGFIYTDANGGSRSGDGTTRAGFYGPSGYYYLVTDPRGFNVGMSIEPFKNPYNGFCAVATCTRRGCSTAFTSPPTHFPSPSNKPSKAPLYSCPQYPNSVGYTVTFCPNGVFPPPPPVTQGLAIHPNYNKGKCLDVRGAVYKNGTPVQIYDCNGSGAQKWILTKGNTQLRVAGTNFCLDAGSHPKNGVGMKIWTCYDNVEAQKWYYTDDKRIALTGQGLCLDLTKGDLSNGNQVQTWKCGNGNKNQVWTV
ncbi:hypothetical protein D9615_010311 [Tricholomella constricta]|uniref:Ricin B lectin domain-containing protein n=1 Tax=Tricholomella constricta TaxID=117010 RepID=A0A8H5GPH5_9AGAR|nr:hypothetical protein D9615_010311 [Tricholomella constricta]